MKTNNGGIEVIRLNSRIKHWILEDYLYPWAIVLGKNSEELNYIDCFAGCGKYECDGEEVFGSPVAAINAAQRVFADKEKFKLKLEKINIYLSDEDEEQVKKLKMNIPKNYDTNKINVIIENKKAENVIFDEIKKNTTIPSFFFVDPYGYLVPVELLKKVIEKPRTEMMLNFMYYGIIRNIENPQEKLNITKVFGNDIFTADLKTDKKFVTEKVINYFAQKLGKTYYIPYKVNFGSDEKVSSSRLKYLLMFFTKSFKGFNIMLDVMWKNTAEGKKLMVSDDQLILFPLQQENDLEKYLKQKYCSTNIIISFEKLVETEWKEYYQEKHFRKALNKMKENNLISVIPVSSKTSKGLKGEDQIVFRGIK